MNFELYIENLGAIEKAEITINPLTILAGENGTGKSFVTKFLYSILNVLMKDVYKQELVDIVNRLKNNNYNLRNDINKNTYDKIELLLSIISNYLNDKTNILDNDYDLQDINKILNNYCEELDEIMNRLISEKSNYPFGLRTISSVFSGTSGKLSSINESISLIPKFYDLIENPENGYLYILQRDISSELKYNFQVSNLNQIIRRGCKNLVFEINGIFRCEIENDDINIINKINILDGILKINNLIFFESSIYWKLSKNFIENSNLTTTYYLSDKISDERLTGIPKHFLDLRDLVFANFKNGERQKFIEECANDLQKSLNGKFNTDSYDLSFETNQGQTISKNLVSFGMTNLGILQAVLNKNIINKGSFVFIDEPESNLHPEWQAVLADILVKLAENGVFVVITTHSSDMLKALDVISQERKNNDEFISVNYFEKGGNLLPLNNDDISPIQQARLKLLETYDEMVLRGYLL